MSDTPVVASADARFAIAYEKFTSPTYNRDFKGKGTLTIRSAGPEYVFAGRPRKTFARQPTELAIPAVGICDVTVTGCAVRFQCLVGGERKRDEPFLFFARTKEEAHAIAQLLPGSRTTDFETTNDFVARLNALPQATRPWTSATNIIVALNLLVFVLMATWLNAGWIDANGLAYLRYGSNHGAATTHGEWWRLVTSLFMHFGVVHVLVNMWALFEAGHFLEKIQGRGLYVLTYLASGLAGGFASILWHGQAAVNSAGASGAVFGVYGAIGGFMLREEKSLPRGIYQAMLKSSVTFAGYNLLYGLVHPGIDNAAHIGGALAGIGFGWLLAMPVEREARTRLHPRRLQLGLAALAVLIGTGVAVTPHFDYVLNDELAWAAAVRPFPPREKDLLQNLQRTAVSLDTDAKRIACAGWIETNLLPFYAEWDRAISALPLEPDFATARRRTRLSAIFQLRMESYRHLIAGLRANEPAALARYQSENDAVVAEIEKLAAE